MQRVDGIRATFERCLAVADVIKAIGIAAVGINRSDSVCQLALFVASVRERVVLRECAAGLSTRDATTGPPYRGSVAPRRTFSAIAQNQKNRERARKANGK